MRLNKLLVACSILALSQGVNAAGAGIRVGTTGLGVDFGFDIVPTLAGRIGYSGAKYDTTSDYEGVNYDVSTTLSNFALLLDWSPLGPFRLTGGFIPNANKASMTATPTNGTYNINGVTYTSAELQSLNGSIKPGNNFSPYLGFGYGNVSGKGVNFYFDLGVMYMGSPNASLSATCGAALSSGQCTSLQNNVAAEQSNVNNDIKGNKWYPVANIGITIGF